MKTLNINQIELNSLFQNKNMEPVLVKNEFGTDYLIMPFSQNNWQEIFLMLYESFSELRKKDEKTLNEERITAKEFGKKWIGILSGIEESDIQNEYHSHLIKKYL